MLFNNNEAVCLAAVSAISLAYLLTWQALFSKKCNRIVEDVPLWHWHLNISYQVVIFPAVFYYSFLADGNGGSMPLNDFISQSWDQSVPLEEQLVGTRMWMWVFVGYMMKDTVTDMDPMYWVHHIACVIIAGLTYVGLPPCMFTFASCFAELGGGFLNLWKVGICPRWLTMIVMTASNFTVAYLLYPMWLIENDSPYIFETLCMTTFLVAGLMAERERQTILVLYYSPPPVKQLKKVD